MQEGAAHNSVSSRPAQHGVMQPQDPSWITKLLGVTVFAAVLIAYN